VQSRVARLVDGVNVSAPGEVIDRDDTPVYDTQACVTMSTLSIFKPLDIDMWEGLNKRCRTFWQTFASADRAAAAHHMQWRH